MSRKQSSGPSFPTTLVAKPCNEIVWCSVRVFLKEEQIAFSGYFSIMDELTYRLRRYLVSNCIRQKLLMYAGKKQSYSQLAVFPLTQPFVKTADTLEHFA